MTLNIDLLTPKVDLFMALPCGPLVPMCIKSGSAHLFSKFLFTKGRTSNGGTHELTGPPAGTQTFSKRLYNVYDCV